MAIPIRQADVLVLGAGLAGLAAALEARRAGRDVLLVARHPPGRSGNSLLAACNFSGVFAPDDTVDAFVRDTLRGGSDIGDPDLVRVVARGSRELIPFLERLGVAFQCPSGDLAFRANPGHAVARTVATSKDEFPHPIGGLSVTLPLARAVAAAGVRFCRGSAEWLLVREGRVCGARIRTAEGVFLAAAGAVVLATGGGGRLFARSDNAADVTGDGLALAYAAGAELRDLEFVQFHPTVATWPIRGVLPTTLFAEGAVLRNRLGERFLAGNFPRGESSVTRDAMSRAIVAEVEAGRGEGGGVCLDLSGVPGEILKTYPEVWAAMAHRGLDPGGQPIRVGPAVHYWMGGVTVDAGAAATLPGLFAAGEVTGGVHGANRLGGNALTESAVLGRVAGRSAARAASRPPSPGILTDEKGRAVETVEAPRAVLRQLGRVLWEHGGIRRSGAGLELGISRLGGLAKEAARDADGGAWSPLSGRLALARLLLGAALRRSESRGAHFREDAPESDPGWRGSLRVTRGDGLDQPVFRFQGAPETGSPSR